MGFKSDDGQPINKPWHIATNSDYIFKHMDTQRCIGCPSHHACAGKYTKISEEYTDDFATLVHKAWRKEAQEQLSRKSEAKAVGGDGAGTSCS